MSEEQKKIEYVVFEEDGDDGCGNGTMRLYQFRRPTLEAAVKVLDASKKPYGITRFVNDEPDHYDFSPEEIAEVRARLARPA